MVGGRFGRGVQENHEIPDPLQRDRLNGGLRRLALSEIARERVELYQIALERGRHRAHQQLRTEAVSHADDAEEIVAVVAERVIEVDPIETGDELTRIGLADALGRALATPERQVIERTGKRAPTPAEIDADQLEAVVRCGRRRGLAARPSIVGHGELDVQALERLLERFHVVVAALRGVMPAVDEQQDERITCGGGAADRVQRPVGLIGLPEPALVVRFDEVEIEPLVHDRGFVTQAIRFVQVAGAAGDKRRRDCEREMNMSWPHGVPHAGRGHSSSRRVLVSLIGHMMTSPISP